MPSVERWGIPSWPGYSITRDGRVWSEKSQRWLVRGVNWDGYLTIKLCCEGKQQKFAIHYLLLITFVGPPGPRQQCRHLNGNQIDNRLENICWGTVQENADDRRRHGTRPKGERIHTAKLTEEQVQEIKRRLATGEKQYIIAEDYLVGHPAIGQIARGTTWRHVC